MLPNFRVDFELVHWQNLPCTGHPSRRVQRTHCWKFPRLPFCLCIVSTIEAVRFDRFMSRISRKSYSILINYEIPRFVRTHTNHRGVLVIITAHAHLHTPLVETGSVGAAGSLWNQCVLFIEYSSPDRNSAHFRYETLVFRYSLYYL